MRLLRPVGGHSAARALGVAVAASLLASCGSEGGTGVDEGDLVDRVVVSPSSAQAEIGSGTAFAATVLNRRGEDVTAGTAVTWSVDPAAVAVATGTGGTATVTGVAAGEATVRASAGEVSGTARVTVVDPDPPAAPSEVAATVLSDVAVDVTWTDNAINEDEFRIEREAVQGASAGGSENGTVRARAFTKVGTVEADATTFRDLTATPATAYRYRVRACNENGCTPDGGEPGSTTPTVTTEGTLTVVTETLPGAVLGTPYQTTLEATGGDGTYAWEVSGGALPPGLTLEGGVLAGTPSSAGSFPFTFTVRSNRQEAQRAVQLEVVELPPLVVTTDALPSGQVGEVYAVSLTAAGGDASYVWDLAPGSPPLPAGLSLSPGGTLSGTPAAAGTTTFAVRVRSGVLEATKELTLLVAGGALVFERSLLAGAYLGVPYGHDIDPASGGSGAPVSYVVVDGELPPGVTLSGSTLSGTPSTPGVFFFEIRATDGTAAVSDVFSLTVSTNPPSGFNLHAHSVADAIPEPAVQAQLDASLARYERIVTSDVPDFPVPVGEAASSCGGEFPALWGATVDDVHLLLDLTSIDGTGGILGRAGFCGYIRTPPDPSPIMGILTLDLDDLESPGFSASEVRDLIWHEIGHVMGFGGGWRCSNCGYDTLVEGTDGTGGLTPTYLGARGVAEYNALQAAAGEPPSAAVPVEGDFGSGTVDSHWDEGAFDAEIMTGFSESGANEYVSRLTLAAFEDLRWTVDYAEADAFTLPGCRPFCGAAPPPGVPGQAAVSRPPLRDEVILEPVWVVGPDGAVIREVLGPGGS